MPNQEKYDWCVEAVGYGNFRNSHWVKISTEEIEYSRIYLFKNDEDVVAFKLKFGV